MKKEYLTYLKDRLDSYEALVFVKNRLSDFQELPKSGVVAGQAVSSAVIEFLNFVFDMKIHEKMLKVEERYKKNIDGNKTIKVDDLLNQHMPEIEIGEEIPF